MALVASYGVLRMVLRLCCHDRTVKMRFWRSYSLQQAKTWATFATSLHRCSRG